MDDKKGSKNCLFMGLANKLNEAQQHIETMR